MAEKYDSEYWTGRNFEPDKYGLMTFQWMEHFEPHSVLDYGCGKGFHVHCWRSENIDAIGYDISQFAIENAYELAKGHTFMTLPDNQFDLVTCLDVLEHVEENSARAIIKELFEKTKDGGNCLFSICMYSHGRKDANFDLDKTHILLRSRDWWEHEIAKAGFEICSVPESFFFKEQFVVAKKPSPHGIVLVKDAVELPMMMTNG